jgi:cofilin
LKKQIKYIIYALNNTKTEVVVHKSSQSADYEEFLADLPETECRWAVYDFEYDNGEGKRKKLLFYSW